MSRSARSARPSRPVAKRARVPDAKAEIRRFITHLDRLAGGPFAPPVRGDIPARGDGR